MADLSASSVVAMHAKAFMSCLREDLLACSLLLFCEWCSTLEVLIYVLKSIFEF